MRGMTRICCVFSVALLALGFLAGCGSSGPGPTTSTSANTGGACGLVSDEEVGKAVGQQVSEEAESSPDLPPRCNYVNGEHKVLVTVAYDASNAQEDMKHFESAVGVMEGPGSTLPELAGIAERASWYGPGATLVAVRKSGSEFFSVTDGELPAEQTEGVAKDLIKSAMTHRS
jgi:hypothetical protein